MFQSILQGLDLIHQIIFPWFQVFTVNNINTLGYRLFPFSLLCCKRLRLPVILLHHLPEYPLELFLKYPRSRFFSCPLWSQAFSGIMSPLVAVVATNVFPQSLSVLHPGLSSVVTFVTIIHSFGFVHSPTP